MQWPVLHQITSNLAISDVYAAQHEDLLRRHRITHIVSLLSFATIQVAEGIKHLRIDILDYPDENIIDEFKITNAWIEQAIAEGGNVLIHCQAGVSRSATVLCAYMMKSLKISSDEALSRIRQKRAFIKPNEGFMEQLFVYGQCGCDPIAGQSVYDDWMRRFYNWNVHPKL